MLLSFAAVVAGVALLVWGGGRCVTGAAATARNLGVPSMVIGLTVVGFGTSTPELLVSGMAAWDGHTGLAIGNAVGSNIVNIGLVLGVAALLAPLTIQSGTLRRELPLVLAATLLTYWLLADGVLGRVDGVILVAGLIAVVYWLVRASLQPRASADPLAAEVAAELPAALATKQALLWLFGGLVVMVVGSRLMVWGSVNIARSFGVSDLVIGLSLVAVGTSLPELVASVMGALKREHDIAFGNVIGSNIFNLLAALGLTGVIHPDEFELDVLTRDFPWMIGLTLLMFMMAYGFRAQTQGEIQRRIGRPEGVVLLLAFCGYMVWLYRTTVV